MRGPGSSSGMAPTVNKLTPEARCLRHPSRRLDTDILWRSVHKGWQKITPSIKKLHKENGPGGSSDNSTCAFATKVCSRVGNVRRHRLRYHLLTPHTPNPAPF